MQTYPENLIHDLNDGLSEDKQIKVPLSEDQMAGLDYVRYLSEAIFRNQLLIGLLYEQGMSCEEVGKVLNMSGEEVSRKRDFYLDRMRYGEYLRFIAVGFKGTVTAIKKKAEEKRIAAVRRIEGTDYLDVLGLSTRADNALRRQGIRTVAELEAALVKGDVAEYKDIGAVSLARITAAVGLYKKDHKRG